MENHLPKATKPREYVHRLLPLYRLAGFEAEDELDKLDRRLFEGCQNLEASRVHADLRLFLQDTPGVIFGLEQLLGHQWDPEAAFDLAEAKLVSGDITEGLSRYGVRFESFPKLEWYKTSARKYVGQPLKDEWLFIWGEPVSYTHLTLPTILLV